MKKASLALSLLALSTTGAWAQSSVTLYGIVDAAVRMTTNAGATAATNGKSIKTLQPGGMSQSRLGINVTEDMGGGLKAIANLEHRLMSDTGTATAADFWRQSWVGLQSNDFGRITLGRQYNILFDIYTSTYPSFRYSPYIEAYKPEIGMSLTARQDNMVKYLVESGGLRGEIQVSAGEGSAAGGKSMGGLLRYAQGEFAVGGAILQLKDGGGKKVTATTFGGNYTSGPLYLTASWARNKFQTGFSAPTNGALAASIVGALNAASALAEHRDMWSVGATYQLDAQWNLGAHYWHAKQNGTIAAGDGKGDFFAVVADYAFSKRTDAYLEFDHTKIGGNLTLANGARKRSGFMMGVRHRF
ncbi:porin [Roseateles toxinivorans]|uniref:Putative porin n=1 Tax=Roseateles toxinivorans TaxID=270368 RepID=A0A4R6QJU1_9BURK|nr:porin [Roseateles toxinivorans]TDP62759.1 putative porin [Roseateles toxinivorans]